MIRLHARPLPTLPVIKLSILLSLPVCRLSSLLTGEGKGGGGRGAESYHREKAWASINVQSSLHAVMQIRRGVALSKIYALSRKVMLSKIEHRPLWFNFTVTSYNKITQIYCRQNFTTKINFLYSAFLGKRINTCRNTFV
jgi:hypothetical protein